MKSNLLCVEVAELKMSKLGWLLSCGGYRSKVGNQFIDRNCVVQAAWLLSTLLAKDEPKY